MLFRSVLPNPPNTELWVVLYAQVAQADASIWRNIQINLRKLQPVRRQKVDKGATSAPRLLEGETRWSGGDVRAALHNAGLPEDAPISALAIELLPEPNGSFDDPLGGDLGQVRILRTSPLSAVERDCCTV